MLKRLGTFIGALAAMSCGGANSTPATPTPTPTQASITLTGSPNPATAKVCSAPTGDDYPFYVTITGTLTVQETAGIGGNLDMISIGGTGSTPVAFHRGSAGRVGANGSLRFPFGWESGLADPNASRSYVLLIYVAMTDDRGNHVSANMTLPSVTDNVLLECRR